MELSICVKCKDYLLWYDKKIVFPIVNNAPPAHPDMPDDVKTIYNEAKSIVSGLRASAALLCTAVELLIDIVVGKNKNTLSHNIGRLVQNRDLPEQVQKSLDYLRVIGDHELHPGVIEMEELDENDFQHTISLFELLNLIVEELIARPKKINEYYERLPQAQKDAIEKRDSKV